jgi:GxxExxY protein
VNLVTNEVRDAVTGQVIGCAIRVHRALGPGLLESAYDQCLAYEFSARGVNFTRQTPVPVIYEQVRLDCGYRVDFIVENNLVVELKAIDQIRPIHQAQIIIYLKLLRIKRGLLINFNVTRLVDGLRSFLC